MGGINLNILKDDLEDIFSSSFDGIYVTDGKGNTLYVNPGSERNYQMPAEKLIGRNVADLEKEGIFVPSVALKVIKEHKRVTLIQETKCGKRIMATGNPIFDENDEIRRVVCNSRDVTELLMLKEQLKETEEQVERYRSELLQLRESSTQIPGLITKSHVMKNIINLIHKVGPVDSSVLIEGESGTGKEVVAKAIHRLSGRREGPFIKVNCGAIPENLLESELFGYETGAFTGAQKGGKVGIFELADSGTLFLDEIGEFSLPLQVKLLQAIQDKAITRLGGGKLISINFRLIAATNRNLADMVKTREFREDLYYRLNVIPIHLPPLRERIEDIPALINYFLKKFNEEYSKNIKISLEAVHKLSLYEWPGNIRELQNVIEQMVVLTEGDVITVRDLPHSFYTFPMQGKGGEVEMLPFDLKDAVAKLERQYISYAMKVTKSTRKTAEFLNISQSTVVRRIKEIHKESSELI